MHAPQSSFKPHPSGIGPQSNGVQKLGVHCTHFVPLQTLPPTHLQVRTVPHESTLVPHSSNPHGGAGSHSGPLRQVLFAEQMMPRAHVPQESVPPQPSGNTPQVAKKAPHVSGLHEEVCCPQLAITSTASSGAAIRAAALRACEEMHKLSLRSLNHVAL